MRRNSLSVRGFGAFAALVGLPNQPFRRVRTSSGLRGTAGSVYDTHGVFADAGVAVEAALGLVSLAIVRDTAARRVREAKHLRDGAFA